MVFPSAVFALVEKIRNRRVQIKKETWKSYMFERRKKSGNWMNTATDLVQGVLTFQRAQLVDNLDTLQLPETLFAQSTSLSNNAKFLSQSFNHYIKLKIIFLVIHSPLVQINVL